MALSTNQTFRLWMALLCMRWRFLWLLVFKSHILLDILLIHHTTDIPIGSLYLMVTRCDHRARYEIAITSKIACLQVRSAPGMLPKSSKLQDFSTSKPRHCRSNLLPCTPQLHCFHSLESTWSWIQPEFSATSLLTFKVCDWSLTFLGRIFLIDCC